MRRCLKHGVRAPSGGGASYGVAQSCSGAIAWSHWRVARQAVSGCDGVGHGAFSGSTSVRLCILRRSRTGRGRAEFAGLGAPRLWPSLAHFRSHSRNAWRATPRDPAVGASTLGHARRSPFWARQAFLFRSREFTAPSQKFSADSRSGRVALVQLFQQPCGTVQGRLAARFWERPRCFARRREGQRRRFARAAPRGADTVGVLVGSTRLHDACGSRMQSCTHPASLVPSHHRVRVDRPIEVGGQPARRVPVERDSLAAAGCVCQSWALCGRMHFRRLTLGQGLYSCMPMFYPMCPTRYAPVPYSDRSYGTSWASLFAFACLPVSL